jgi:hypothetical protein
MVGKSLGTNAATMPRHLADPLLVDGRGVARDLSSRVLEVEDADHGMLIPGKPLARGLCERPPPGNMIL